MAKVIEALARAAGRAKAAVDAVEIHGAHGYLLNQFLSPFSNRRDDQYGGSNENRMRSILEIITSVRNMVGKDFPVWIRVSADEWCAADRTWTSCRISRPGWWRQELMPSTLLWECIPHPAASPLRRWIQIPGFNLFRARALK